MMIVEICTAARAAPQRKPICFRGKEKDFSRFSGILMIRPRSGRNAGPTEIGAKRWFCDTDRRRHRVPRERKPDNGTLF